MTLTQLLHGNGMSFDEIYDSVGGSKAVLKEKLQKLEDQGLLQSYSGIVKGKRKRIFKLTATQWFDGDSYKKKEAIAELDDPHD